MYFLGYERPDGNVGIRNYVVIIPSVCCANEIAARIAAQVVSGIGFLGAGTIIRSRASIRGLTTAASLWTVAGIGLAVGVGFYQGAYTATLLVLITLFLLNKIEKDYLRREKD